jgi:hypothetical protein
MREQAAVGDAVVDEFSATANCGEEVVRSCWGSDQLSVLALVIWLAIPGLLRPLQVNRDEEKVIYKAVQLVVRVQVERHWQRN